ncbi:MAG: hypothetical protein JW883_13075, partial [Deltaproteobacteria bacterium]|nr:hypothetical protein [Deltaproteobacteria bacterium]
PRQNIIPILPVMFDSAHQYAMATPAIAIELRHILYQLCPRYRGKKLGKIGKQFGVSESGGTQASRRIRMKQENDKKFAKLITKMVK